MVAGAPDKPSLEGLENKWSARWEDEGIYRFERTRPRTRVYSIDTPPPTVSGSLHIGHVLGYTHTDVMARYKRMRGFEVFYPMGWDDNGVPTERRVENYFGVRCDPALGYDAALVLPEKPSRSKMPISRPNFVELCQRLTAQDEAAFEEVWRFVGLSVDWSMTYATIGERARRASQRQFLRLLDKGLAYQAEAPTLWDVDFKTAVAQAEMEDREVPGAFYRIRFAREGGGSVEIETTRPELIPACVALVAHPDDSRYRPLLGTQVTTPLFGARVPVVAHRLADPEKGSGIAMICTFGDVTDVLWWRELGLPVRAVMARDGRIQEAPWGEAGWETGDVAAARRAQGELSGLDAQGARARIVEMLGESGDLSGDPRPIRHAVKFYERGERPLEIVTSRQWFIRTLDMRERLLARGSELRWHPPYMEVRFEAWVNGLSSDWNISRQRFFGVPFPLWYPIDEAGEVDWARPIAAAESRLPVDPSTDAPDGYAEAQRGEPGGFVGEPDVMDTWATSSLTPQIVSGWEDDPDLFERVFPMDLRPQGHDIIRTWLFTSVVRSELEHRRLPWWDTLINGFVLDPDRKKMSKSKGNVVTPMDLLQRHGADAARYWAASSRPGVDATMDEAQMKIGRRLAIKILNASRFVLSRLDNGERFAPADAVTQPLDAAMLEVLARAVEDATSALDGYDYARALEKTESFFWAFCDDYVELVKGRAYGDAPHGGPESARAALALALSAQLRLFAPFLPFVTEEVWSWWQAGSVHRAPWPAADELRGPATGEPMVLDVAAGVLGRVRRAKTEAKLSMRAPVEHLEVIDTAPRLAELLRVEGDLRGAASLEGQLVTTEGEEFFVEVRLAQPA